MTLISIICIAILVTTFIFGLIKNELMSPARLYIFVWTTAIGLADLKLSRLQFEWSNLGWIVLMVGVLPFLLGNFIIYVLNFDRGKKSITQIRNTILVEKINEKLLYNIILIMFFAYLASYFLEYLIEGYVPLFSPQPDLARRDFGVFGLHLIVNSVISIIFLSVEYIILVKKKFANKLVLSIISVLAFITFSFLLYRYIFMILILMIIPFVYFTKGIKPKYFLGIFVFIGLFVWGIKSIRVGQLAELYFFLAAKIKIPYKYAFLSEPYMYITMNLENFVANFEKITSHTYGIFSADFFLALIGTKHWLMEYYNVAKFPHYIDGYNTFPYFWAYFYDFGFWGLAIIPFFIGILASLIYSYIKMKPNLRNLIYYCALVSVILISYTSDPLTRLDIVSNYFIIIIVQYFVLENNVLKK